MCLTASKKRKKIEITTMLGEQKHRKGMQLGKFQGKPEGKKYQANRKK